MRNATAGIATRRAIALVSAVLLMTAAAAFADETCMSPYMAKITKLEDFVYVWTVGKEGVGDGSDKLVTVDVRPHSPSFGQVVNSVSVGDRCEAHHAGFTDDRRQLWAAGLDNSRIFIFDVASDPARPRLMRSIDDFSERSGGVVGPHTMYALPGRMLISWLSNANDDGGRTALVEYSNGGDWIATHWLPTADDPRGAEIEDVADGYGYDLRVLPRRNVMFTTSFTGRGNYMMEFGQLAQDQEAMQRFGQTVTVWDLHTRQPRQVLKVPGAPLELRVAWGPRHDYAFTFSALTSQLWLIHEGEDGKWRATAVADIGDPAQMPLPVDASLSSDDGRFWVTTFGDGKARLFDVSDPFHSRQIYEKKIGPQVNMVSQSWDGERVYFTSSLLSKWDKKGADDQQFLRAYRWDGRELQPLFDLDFYALELGRPHIMTFGSYALHGVPDPQLAGRSRDGAR